MAFVRSDVEMCFQDSQLHGKRDLLLSNRLSQLVQYQLSLLMSHRDQEYSGKR